MAFNGFGNPVVDGCKPVEWGSHAEQYLYVAGIIEQNSFNRTPRTPEGQFHIRRILRQDRRVFSAIYQQEGRGELDTRLNGRAKSILGDQDAHAGCGAQFHVTMGLRSVGQRVAVGNRDFYVTAGDDIHQVAGAGEHFFAIAQMP